MREPPEREPLLAEKGPRFASACRCFALWMASLEVILVVVVVVVVVDALSIDVQALYLGSLMLSCPRLIPEIHESHGFGVFQSLVTLA